MKNFFISKSIYAKFPIRIQPPTAVWRKNGFVKFKTETGLFSDLRFGRKKEKKYPRRTTLLGAPAVTYGIYILYTCLCSSLSHFPSLFLLLLLIYYIELLQRATPATFTAPTATMATDGHNVLRPPPTPPASSTTSGLLHHVRPPPPRPASSTTSGLLHQLRPPPSTPGSPTYSGLLHLRPTPPPPTPTR
jgi:hypothetical protein